MEQTVLPIAEKRTIQADTIFVTEPMVTRFVTMTGMGKIVLLTVANKTRPLDTIFVAEVQV
jgi:hypothetical protein